MNYRNPELRSALSAEYALGTLRGRARQRFERLLHADFALQREVEYWQNALYPTLLETVPEQQPPKYLWQQIKQQTIATATSKKSSAGFWHNLLFLRTWGAVFTVLTVMMLGYLVKNTIDQQSAAEWDYIAIVNDSQEQPAWLVQINLAERELAISTLRPQTIAQQRSLQLWLLPSDQQPQSLGLIKTKGQLSRALPVNLLNRLPDSQALAVSLEPLGGTLSGPPTGPVLYQGKLMPAN